jgi:pimeloyl-ACP methyl ester carboxylesterase
MLGAYLDILAIVSPSQAAQKGFLLFCRPFRTPANEKQRTFFNSGDMFRISHQGHQVQGYRWGNGPKKILFLHGWQSHTYRWKAYIEALAKDEYTIYSLDAPGHGLSSGDFLSVPLYSSLIADFIREHGEIHTAVGHSLGGFSLLYTFYRRPALPVDRIILLAPPGEADDFISAFKKTLGLSDRTVRLVVNHFADRYQVTPGFFSSRRFVENLKVKGLIIHDEDDGEAPYHYSIPLQQAWQQSRLVTTKGYGHNLKSASVVKQVVDFIGEPLHHPALQ